MLGRAASVPAGRDMAERAGEGDTTGGVLERPLVEGEAGAGALTAGAAGFAAKSVVFLAGSSPSALSAWRQLPSKKAPVSTAKASCRMLPSTWQVEQRRTLR